MCDAAIKKLGFKQLMHSNKYIRNNLRPIVTNFVEYIGILVIKVENRNGTTLRYYCLCNWHGRGGFYDTYVVRIDEHERIKNLDTKLIECRPYEGELVSFWLNSDIDQILNTCPNLAEELFEE